MRESLRVGLDPMSQEGSRKVHRVILMIRASGVCKSLSGGQTLIKFKKRGLVSDTITNVQPILSDLEKLAIKCGIG